MPPSACALQSPRPGRDRAGLSSASAMPPATGALGTPQWLCSRGLKATLALGAGGGRGHIGSQAVCSSGKVTHNRQIRGRGSRKGRRAARRPALAPEPPGGSHLLSPQSSSPCRSLSGHVWRWMSWNHRTPCTSVMEARGVACSLDHHRRGQQGPCVVTCSPPSAPSGRPACLKHLCARPAPPGLEPEHPPSPQEQPRALTRAKCTLVRGQLTVGARGKLRMPAGVGGTCTLSASSPRRPLRGARIEVEGGELLPTGHRAEAAHPTPCPQLSGGPVDSKTGSESRQCFPLLSRLRASGDVATS